MDRVHRRLAKGWCKPDRKLNSYSPGSDADQCDKAEEEERRRMEWTRGDEWREVEYSSTVFLSTNGVEHVGGAALFADAEARTIFKNKKPWGQTTGRVENATVVEAKRGRVVSWGSAGAGKAGDERCSMAVVEGVQMTMQVWWVGVKPEAKAEGGGLLEEAWVGIGGDAWRKGDE
jgi:hypothetical protein